MRVVPWLMFLHKWVGLIVGIQIVLWIAGGLVMTYFPIDVVRGEHNIREHEPIELTGSDFSIPLNEIVDTHAPDGVNSLAARTILGRPIYDLDRGEQGHILVDARTGGALTIDEGVVRALARADFLGSDPIAEIGLIHETNLEYRGAVPAWRVQFADSEDTRLYFTADTGRLRARRNETWRLFDFFWMLHIMDYENRVNFNNPLLLTASVFAFITVIFGMVLLVYRIRLKDWNIMRPRALRD